MTPVKKISRLIVGSITAKISIIIFVIETILLCMMGVYYYNRFSSEIDERVAEKMAIPGTLMSELALNFETARDLRALEDLTKEHVVDAFIVRKNGIIFYAADTEREGRHYAAFIDPAESLRLSKDVDLITTHTSESGERFLSILSPLSVKGNLLGFLYIRIHADGIEASKRAIIYLFLLGSILTILLTTLIEAYFVHHMLVPRIGRTVSSLQLVEAGDFSARVSATGPADQIGSLMENVNSMIDQIEVNTKNLQALAQAGEELAEARTRDDIYKVLSRIAGSRFPVEATKVCPVAPDEAAGSAPPCRELDLLDPIERKIVTNGEIFYSQRKPSGDDPVSPENTAANSARLFIPVIELDKVREVICLSVNPLENKPEDSNGIFIRTLSRLMANAIKRTEALAMLSKAERQYRDLFSNAAEGIFLSTMSGRPEAVNPSLSTMLGYASPGKMLESVTDLTTQVFADVEEGTKLYQKIEKAESCQDVELQIRRKDGATFWASVSAHAVKSSEDGKAGVEGSIVDVSERKRIDGIENRRRVLEAAHEARSEVLAALEQKNKILQQTLEELRDTQARLVQSEKMAAIGTMAGGVAHDLNNILAGIVSYPDLLLMQLPLDSGLRESIEVIRESGTRAAAVVSDLLTTARGVAYNTVLFDVNYLIEKHLKSPEFKALLQRYPDVRVRTRLAPHLRYTKCSPIHIEKALMNLSTNAFEAIREEGDLVISTENITVGPEDNISRSLRPGEYVAVKVSDSGPGIPEGDLERVFEPFYTRKVLGRSGSGLGLAVVWGTAQEHGGTVIAESDGGGAIFTMYLPASAETAAGPTESEPPSLDELKGSGTVLVVDDEFQIRHIATRMLTMLGYSVEAVSSGEEALELLRTRSVDLVILDMIMDPGMNGYKTYREICAIHPGQKALISSGYSEHKDVEKSMKLGVGGFLKKPYTVEQLGAAAKKALARHGGPAHPGTA